MTALEIAFLTKVEKDWKDFTPSIINKGKIEFIENNLNKPYLKSKIVDYLSDIENDNWRLIQQIKLLKNRVSDIEITQSKLVSEKLNNWIKEINDKLFS